MYKRQSLTCRREIFRGESSVPTILPGFTFDLKDHYRSTFNQSYLVTEVHHEGNQAAYLVSGLSMQSTESPFYTNSFTAIPSNIQFRPERSTPKPRISGSISAKVDAAGSGQYAELDEHGRYKVVLPFDTSGRRNGKASTWIRMATPYAGSDHGMHFPLHKDTEVLLTFIDGDPDRPIIASAVPNPENPSPVSSTNQTKSIITTGSGNKIHMEDQAGSERILMHSPNQQSFIRIGAHNDPTTEPPGTTTEETTEEKEEDNKAKFSYGVAEKTAGVIEIEAAARNEIILGWENDMVLGVRIWFTGGIGVDAALAAKYTFQAAVLAMENTKSKLGVQELRETVEHTVAHAVDNQFGGMEAEIAERVTDSVGMGLDGIAQGTNLLARKVRNVIQSNGISANVLRTTGTTIQTQGQKVDNALSSLENAGTHLKNAGQSLENVGSHVENAGTLIADAGAEMRQSATCINTAGLTLIN